LKKNGKALLWFVDKQYKSKHIVQTRVINITHLLIDGKVPFIVSVYLVGFYVELHILSMNRISDNIKQGLDPKCLILLRNKLLPPIHILDTNTDVSSTKMCLDMSILATSNMGWRKYLSLQK
jgi:hypothetical protein